MEGAEPMSTKSLQWESDVPIKQTIMTEGGHCFHGCVSAVRSVGASRKEHSDHPREVRTGSLGSDSQLRCEGCGPQIARGRAFCAEQERQSKGSF